MKIYRSMMWVLLILYSLVLSSNASVRVDADNTLEFSMFYVYDVPYVRQNDTYWCGPASLTMTLNYWGANVTQEEVAAKIYDPATNLTSIPKMKAYPQELRFKAEESTGSINYLKEWVRRGCPLIVLQTFSLQDKYGHYRVVVGYDDDKELVVTFDPILGSNYNITYVEFAELWKPGSTFTTSNWTLLVTPENKVLTNLMGKYQLLLNQKMPSNDERRISLEDIFFIVSVFALIFGVVGGIPQIMRWMEPKPRLRISKASIKAERGNRITIDLEVKNEKKWWGRNRDATYVTAEWFIMDKNHEQWGAVFNRSLSPYLMEGTKVTRQFSSSHSFKVEGNPYTIVIRVKCTEGVVRREKITYRYLATYHEP